MKSHFVDSIIYIVIIIVIIVIIIIIIIITIITIIIIDCEEFGTPKSTNDQHF